VYVIHSDRNLSEEPRYPEIVRWWIEVARTTGADVVTSESLGVPHHFRSIALLQYLLLDPRRAYEFLVILDSDVLPRTYDGKLCCPSRVVFDGLSSAGASSKDIVLSRSGFANMSTSLEGVKFINSWMEDSERANSGVIIVKASDESRGCIQKLADAVRPKLPGWSLFGHHWEYPRGRSGFVAAGACDESLMDEIGFPYEACVALLPLGTLASNRAPLPSAMHCSFEPVSLTGAKFKIELCELADGGAPLSHHWYFRGDVDAHLDILQTQTGVKFTDEQRRELPESQCLETIQIPFQMATSISVIFVEPTQGDTSPRFKLSRALLTLNCARFFHIFTSVHIDGLPSVLGSLTRPTLLLSSSMLVCQPFVHDFAHAISQGLSGNAPTSAAGAGLSALLPGANSRHISEMLRAFQALPCQHAAYAPTALDPGVFNSPSYIEQKTMVLNPPAGEFGDAEIGALRHRCGVDAVCLDALLHEATNSEAGAL